MIYITGDIHGSYDIHKFSASCFKDQKELTRSDYVIICGDFGLLWDKDSRHDKYWLEWLDEKPWTTLWIDGKDVQRSEWVIDNEIPIFSQNTWYVNGRITFDE